MRDVYFADTVAGGNVADGNWHHVADVYDGSEHKTVCGRRLSTLRATLRRKNEGANVAVGEVVPWLFTVGATMNPEFPQTPSGTRF